jgi:NAD(P)-dependent dehydrogenase (short-subunit alcohol dehydrogenase family)
MANTIDLGGRTAVVTGGAQGIGRAIADGLADEGAKVVIADLGGAEEAAAELTGNGTAALGLRVDVSSEPDCAAMAQAVLDRFGRIDGLVNNAGIYSSLVPQPLEEIDIDEWRKVFDVNVLGMFLATRAVLPQMRTQGGGRIVNISSGTPFKGVPYLLHYVSSKGAVVAMTKAIAKEVGDTGILVNTVAPGFTMSDGVLANPVQVQKLQEISVKARVIQRDQFPSDVVGAIVFFCSDDSSFITGQSLVVDGGAFFN